MDPLAQLKIGLSNVELIKEQFDQEQRLLLIAGRGSSWADFHEGQSDGIIVLQKRKSKFPPFDIGRKKRKGGASEVKFDDLPIHPNVKPLFVEMKNQYRQLENSALTFIANETNEQQLTELHNFRQKIVQSSWVVLLHVSPILNAAVVSKTDVVICALAGYESQILGKKQRNLVGKEKFEPTCTVTGHLIKEDHARKIPTNGLSTTEFQQSRFYLEYATKADGEQEPEPPVPLLWIDEDPMDTTGFCAIFMARLFSINPKKREDSVAAQKQPLWEDGYHLAFFAQIHSPYTVHEEFLGITLPFEIVSNYSNQKEAKWRETLWRLAVCTEDKFFTTRPKETGEIGVVHLLQEMSKWLKGYVGTDVGLNTVHIMNLRRLLAKEWGCYSGNVDYSKFGIMWPYFFKATEFIKQNRDTLWKTNLMNYCFTSAMEAEALLSQKTSYTLLIRLQFASKRIGIPAISLIVPGDEVNLGYMAHADLQSLTNGELKVYDLPHILKYSMLFITIPDSGDQRKYIDGVEFTDFEVYGCGKTDVTQYAKEHPQVDAGMTTGVTKMTPNAPLAGYAGKREVTYLIQVVPLEPEMLDRRLSQMLNSPLGTVLSSNGTRQNLEWLCHEIHQLKMQDAAPMPNNIERDSSEQYQDDQVMSQRFRRAHSGAQAHPDRDNQCLLQPQAIVQPRQRINHVPLELNQATVNEEPANYIQKTPFGMPQHPEQQSQMEQSVQNVLQAGPASKTLPQDTAPKPPHYQVFQAYTHTHFRQAQHQPYGAQHTPQGMMQGQHQYNQGAYIYQPMPEGTYNQAGMHVQQPGYGRPESTEGMQHQIGYRNMSHDQEIQKAQFVTGSDGAAANERFSSPNIHNQQHFRQGAPSGAYGQGQVRLQQNSAAPVMQMPPPTSHRYIQQNFPAFR